MYIIEDQIAGVTFRKTVYSRRWQDDPEQVDHRLVVPHGRRINFIVTAWDFVKCRFRVRSQGFNYLATLHNFTGGQVRIQYGIHRALPSSQAGYPLPTDQSMVMPIEVEGALEPAYWLWYLSNQGEQGNAAVPVPQI